MPKTETPEHAGWLLPAMLLVLALTAARVILLATNRMDLFVDEAQYWLWGQELAFGYYSKPPMIGWLIRAVTDLAGSDAPFWVRVPAPVLHGVTALILGGIAARLYDARAALLVVAGYITLPMVAVGSILMSTDTVMFPFLALALMGYLRLLRQENRWVALLTGLALGLAFLAKYAAIYYLICAGLLALVRPDARLSTRSILILLGGFLITISPNILWNLQNGFSTLQHTLDNAAWVRDPGARAGLNPGSLLSFVGAQFAVFGPVLFGALIWLSLRARRSDARRRTLLFFSLPILAIVCVQALLSNAYANWAASAYLAGTLVVLPWLPRPWLILSFVVNGGLSLALPVIGSFAEDVTLGNKHPVLERYLGRDELSAAIVDKAEDAGAGIVIAENRDVLADLFYSARDSGITFYALPPRARAPHHYALKYPYPGGTQPVLFVTSSRTPPPCAQNGTAPDRLAPADGAYRGKAFNLYLLPGTCWSNP